MKNKNKIRKQLARTGISIAKRDLNSEELIQVLENQNVEDLDRLADQLGIKRLSDYLHEKQEEAKVNGLCTCPK